jgi:hypothetical protein
MPAMDRPTGNPVREQIRVPLLPSSTFSTATSDEDATVMRPEINLASGGGQGDVSAMSEVVDNDSAEIDVYRLTEQVKGAMEGAVKAASKKVEEGVEKVKEGEGMVRQVWRGFVDDLLGERKVGKA